MSDKSNKLKFRMDQFSIKNDKTEKWETWYQLESEWTKNKKEIMMKMNRLNHMSKPKRKQQKERTEN